MTKLILILCGVVVLSGCLMTRNELREAEGRRGNQDQVIAMQKQTAPVPQTDSQNRFSEIEDSLRALNGRLEVVEHRSSQVDVNSGKNQKQLEELVQDVQRKILLLQEEMIKLDGQLQALNQQIAATAEADAKAKVEASKSESKVTSGKDKQTPFEIGEELFEKKEWKKAILSYQKYRETYPKGKKYAESTYKIGVCFQELGMKDDAKTFYDELIGKFPSSQEARRAKIRLKNLK